MTPTMTRAGDPLPGFPAADPTTQPERKVPAAAAFHGDYTVTRSRRDQPGAPETANHEVVTACLRAEDRCVTTSTSTAPRDPTAPFAEFSVLQFGEGTFGRTAAAASRACDGGGQGVATESETLALPPNASTPLRTLTCERVATFTAGCAGKVVDDVEYALTSD
jgi:hypothetical protein